MVMTLKDHRLVEADGELSPHQARMREIGERLSAAIIRRDREDRRMARLFALERLCEARHRAACDDVALAMAELREMRT